MPKPAIAFMVTCVAAFSLSTLSAQAQSRYTPPPAVTLSGDLASPWVMQLKNRPIFNRKMVDDENHYTNYWSRKVKRKKAKPGSRIQADPVSLQAPRRQKKTSPINQMWEYDDKYLPQRVAYQTQQKPGTIIIDTRRRYLYLVENDGQATRYGVGVGRRGFEWSGTEKITRKAEWPDWRPPAEMRERERKKGRELPVVMEGGPDNPLGARALYLGGTLYRIHGTNQPWTIGKAMSSGCIRMRNEDVTELYNRVSVGTKVVVM